MVSPGTGAFGGGLGALAGLGLGGSRARICADFGGLGRLEGREDAVGGVLRFFGVRVLEGGGCEVSLGEGLRGDGPGLVKGIGAL